MVYFSIARRLTFRLVAFLYHYHAGFHTYNDNTPSILIFSFGKAKGARYALPVCSLGRFGDILSVDLSNLYSAD
jgi:hypothetical protein